MKAVQKFQHGYGNIHCVEVPEPSPERGQVKIKIAYTGICGSDLHFYDESIPLQVPLPLTLGHEFSGVVVEVGEGVKEWQVGDRVTAETAKETCGVCERCQTGQHSLCTQRRAFGQQLDGVMAEYICTDAKRVHKVPDNVSLLAAAMCEPSCVAYHAVLELTNVKPGDLAVVIGPGPIGLGVVQMLAAAGAHILLLGRRRNQKRMELGLTMGAAEVLYIDEASAKDRVNELSDNQGADYIFDCAGKDDAIEMGIDLCKKGGTFVEVALTNFAGSTIRNFGQIVMKEICFQGSFSHRYMNWDRVLRMMSRGKLDVLPMVSHKFKLEDCVEAFEAKDKLKVMFEIHPEE